MLVIVGVDRRILISARRTMSGLRGIKSVDIGVKVKKIQCSGKEKKMEIVIGVLVVIALVFVIVYLVQRT